jgi:DNA-nicking Smr family endonuclease
MMSLDLHGVKHHDVPRKIDEFIWDIMQKKKTQCVIITGKSNTMKDIVKSCVKDYDAKCFELFDGGSLVIDLF